MRESQEPVQYNTPEVLTALDDAVASVSTLVTEAWGITSYRTLGRELSRPIPTTPGPGRLWFRSARNEPSHF